MNTKIKSNYGTFSVSTEGDVEGISTTQLGVYEGYIDEIALYLDNKKEYSLSFERVKNIELNPTSGTTVISYSELGLNSVEEAVEFFKDRPVEVFDNSQYKCIRISHKNRESIDVELAKDKIRSKLTLNEQKLMGLV